MAILNPTTSHVINIHLLLLTIGALTIPLIIWQIPVHPSTMEFSRMTQRWSSTPKLDKAARIRGNQRRHRARAKAYIADLEKQLADTQSRLNEALARNAELVSELEDVRTTLAEKSITSRPNQIRDDVAPRPPSAVMNVPSIPTDTSIPRNEEGSPLPTVLSPQHVQVPERSLYGLGEIQAVEASVTPHSEKGYSLPPMQPLKRPQQPESLNTRGTITSNNCPSSSNIPTRASWTEANIAVLFSDYAHLPPPALGESTIPCKVAYDIIEQQNYIGLAPQDIHLYLGPGFRGATIRGDGCRVKSNLVFAIIDAISSS